MDELAQISVWAGLVDSGRSEAVRSKRLGQVARPAEDNQAPGSFEARHAGRPRVDSLDLTRR